jgi:phosphatidylglycerol:prolipoprotein diacylglycerol transferase
MASVFAGISYTTFPEINLGPLTLRTFGLMVGIGVVVGAWLAAKYIESRTGTPREQTYSLATRMVVAGIIGSRITWVISHWDEIENPIDIIAVWEGGLQFSGGFIAAVIVGFPAFRKWPRLVRWRNLDGYAYGLTAGLAIGRIGCYSVGEHFGSTTSFFLGTTYQGGSTREGLSGTTLETSTAFELGGVGTTFHHTALYEFGYLAILFGVFTYLLYGRANRPKAGTIIGIFCLYYGIMRFLSDALRVNDTRVLGLTGAQYMCLALVPVSLWILFKVRPALVAIQASGAVGFVGEDPEDGASNETTPAEILDDEDAVDDDPAGDEATDEEVDADAGGSDADDADYPSIDRS